MAGILNNKILIGGAIAIIFLGVFVVVQKFLPMWQACQQLECECGVNGVNLRSPLITIRQKLDLNLEIMGYEFLYPQKLVGRCARIFFKFNDTHTFGADVCPKDLTELEIKELGSATAPYPLPVEGDIYYYASDLHYLISPPETGELEGTYVGVKFLNKLISLIET